MELHSTLDTFDGVSPVSVVLALTTVLVTILYYAIKNRGLPPGPIGLPFLGYWFFLDNKTSYLQLEKFKKKHGDVFSFTCTGRLYINLGTAKTVREAHISQSDNFAGRITDFTLISHIFEDGVVFSNGENWRTLRKFFLQVFKDRGMSSIKDSMCGPMYDCINTVVEHLRAKKGEPVNITEILVLKCNTILRQALFGENGVTDEQILEINKQYGKVTEGFTPKNMLLSGLFSKYLIFPFRSDISTSLDCHKRAKKLFLKMIADHKATYDPDNTRDIIDEFYKEKDKRQRNGDPSAEHFTDQALLSTLVQFVGDGAVNVAAFVSLFLLKVTDHPEEQEKIYQELVDVVGDRQPTVDDKSKLTYTNAFIMEALRMSDFVPYFPSMECTRETTLRGYRIPKGAITVSNMWTSHFDPEVYHEPEKFNPSRFISKEGKQRPELPITFGLGKRSCLGEAFVMTQTFLFLTTIIKNFRLSAAKGNLDSFDMVRKRIFLTCAHPRNQK